MWGLVNAPAHATTLAFMALAQIGHLGNARSTSAVLQPARVIANPSALGAVALSVGPQVGVIDVEPLPRLLRVTPLAEGEWIVVVGLAAVPAVVGQIVKLRRPHLRGTARRALRHAGL